MTLDLATRDGVERFSAGILDSARGGFGEVGRVLAQVHIFATQSFGPVYIPPGQVGVLSVLPEGPNGAPSKDQIASLVRRTVMATKAIGVLMLHEAYMAMAVAGSPEADRLRKAGAAGALGQEPGRAEIVYVQLEHIRSSWVKLATITRPEGRPSELGPWVVQAINAKVGRFADLLNRERFA